MTNEQKTSLIEYRQLLRDLPSTVNLSEYNSDTIYECFPAQPMYINLSPF